jgi:hypothetical protein
MSLRLLALSAGHDLPQKYSSVIICVREFVNTSATVRMEGLCQLKLFNDLIMPQTTGW